MNEPRKYEPRPAAVGGLNTAATLATRQRHEIDIGQFGSGQWLVRTEAERRRELMQGGIAPILENNERDRQRKLGSGSCQKRSP